MKRTTYQTVEVTLPNASPAGIAVSALLVNPDKDYPFVTAVFAKVINAGGANYLSLGVADSNGNVVAPLPSAGVETNESVGHEQGKYMPIGPIKNDGRTIKALVVPDIATTTANGKVVFSFMLQDTEEARPSVA